jgi:hypothetical protein
MNAPLARRRRLILLLGALAAMMLPAGAAVLYTFPPGTTPFYPPCLFHWLTGLHCPGCGATRCLHALLHGDVPQAVAYNPLMLAAIPIVMFAVARVTFAHWMGRSTASLPRWTYVAVFWTVLAFGLLRNAHFYPLTLLAPHTL